MDNFWHTVIVTPLKTLWENMVNFLPNLLSMIVILLVGLLVSWLVKQLLYLLLKLIKFDRLSYRMGITSVLKQAGIAKTPGTLVALIVYWILLFTFLTFALNTLKIAPMETLITQFFIFIPRLLTAFVILLGGYLISIFLERATLIGAVNARIKYAKGISSAIQLLTLIFFLAVAFEQLGIAEGIVVATFSILFGGLILALALAFGLGGRDLAREFLEKRIVDGRSEEEPDEISHL